MAEENVSVVPVSESTETFSDLGDSVAQTQAEATPQEVALEALDPNYVARANREYGLTEAQLRAAPRELVEHMMTVSDRRATDVWQRASQQFPQQTPPNAAQPVATTTSDFKVDPLEITLDGVEEDSPTATAIQAINKHYAAQLEKMHQHYSAKFDGVNRGVVGLQEQAQYGVIDDYITRLGDEWSDVFGRGRTLSMHPQSKERIARTEFLRAAVANNSLYGMLYGQTLSDDEAMDRARLQLHQDKVLAKERAKAAKAQESVRAGASTRPKTAPSRPQLNGIDARVAQMLGR